MKDIRFIESTREEREREREREKVRKGAEFHSLGIEELKQRNMREEYFSLGTEAVKCKFRITKWDEFVLEAVYLDGVDISNIIVALDRWDETEEDFSEQLRESVKEWKKQQ